MTSKRSLFVIMFATAIAMASGCSSCQRTGAELQATEDPRATALVTAYWQKSGFNCTSIAFTKAALYKYGTIDPLFASLSRDASGVHATTRANAKYDVTPAEIETVKASIGVEHTDEKALQEAATLYAFLGKACMADCTGKQRFCTGTPQLKCDTFESAVKYLNTGLLWSAPPSLLDITEGKDLKILKGWKGGRWWRIHGFVQSNGSCVAATPWHTYFVAGSVYDRYGEAVHFSHGSSKHGLWALHAYCLGDVDLKVEKASEQKDEAYQQREISQ